MDKFGWAYIGCGRIAHTTAKELVKSDSQRIVAVYNRTYEKAEKFVKQFGGRAYKTFEEAVNAPGVDGVYIAVTADKHAEFVRKCIDNGKPVLCEKPFAVNAAQAKELFAYAKEKNVYVSEAMWTWHNAVAEKVREWVSSGRVGEVKSVDCAYAFPMLQFSRGNSRIMDPAQIGGAVMDIGIYGIRYCYELFGMPKAVKCKGRLDHGADLGEIISLRYENFEANLKIALDKKVGEYFKVSGTDGEIEVPFFHMASKATLKGKTTDAIEDKAPHYERQFGNVAAEIREGLKESRKVPAGNTIDCLKIMDACRKQMGLKFPCEMESNPAAMNLKAISHLGFNCKDVEKSIAFYRDIMGCTVKFVLTYGDIVRDVEKQCREEGKKEPLYLKALRRFSDKKWSVYMQWPGTDSFIELFYQMGARKPRIPGNSDLNYTHYSLEVADIRAFRQELEARGGAKYIDTEITCGVEHTWQFWMHDPDGNKFEIMEYTPESYQVAGRKE